MENNHTTPIEALSRLTHSAEYRGYIEAKEAFDTYLAAFVVVNREELSRISPLDKAKDADEMVGLLREGIDTGMVRPS
jgi:hypothetical protein